MHLSTRCYLLAGIVVLGICVPAWCQQRQAGQTLQLTCLSEPFLSISASVQDHTSIPPVTLALVSPAGEIDDPKRKLNNIPNSRYGAVVDIPSRPHNSLALALEVCNAERGSYELRIAEDSTARYRITIRASGAFGKTNEAILDLYHVGKPGRSRSYRFVFRIEHKEAFLNWLDGHGTEKQILEQAEW